MANELKTAEMLSSKVAGDKQENVQFQNNPSNRDVNGVNDRNASTKDKNLVNDSKTIQDKKPTANGDIKPPSSLPELKKEKSALKTPTRKISPKSPEPTSATLGDKKKVPMNKVQVGSAPSPNLKVVRSKIGSLENYTHKPGGGKVKIENRKLEWKVQPRIEAKNDKYAPSGGDKKITQVKLQWSAKSKIGSLENATHKPGGGDKKIESVKLDFKDKAKPKVGSKDNIKHTPGGGTVKKTTDTDAKSISSNIEDQKLEVKAQSKVGSLDNVKHRPGGGDKKIFDDKEYLKQTATTNENSKANSVTTSGSQAPEDAQICPRDSQQKEKQIDKQIAATEAITSQKVDKPAKEPEKPKIDQQSPKKEKKSQPSTPKKSLSAVKETENKPAPTIEKTPEKTSQKCNLKKEEKVDTKFKQSSDSQLKPELEKIPSKEKFEEDVLKDKRAVVHESKPSLDHAPKPNENKVPYSDRSASESKNLIESKSTLSEEAIKTNNDGIGTTVIKKGLENSTETKVLKNDSENKSSSNTNKSPIKTLQKKDSKPKIEIKADSDVSNKSLNAKDQKSASLENKPELITTKPNDDTNKSPIKTLQKRDSKSKIEIKEGFGIKDQKSVNLENKPELITAIGKEKTVLGGNVDSNKLDLGNQKTDKDFKNASVKPNENNKEPSKLENNSLKEINKSNTSTDTPLPPKPINNQEKKLNSEDKSKSNEQIKPPIKQEITIDEKSKSPKTHDQKTENVQDIKSNSEKSTYLEKKQTTETFSPISKPDSETKSASNSTDQKSQNVDKTSEIKVTAVPGHKVESLSTSEIATNKHSASLVKDSQELSVPASKIVLSENKVPEVTSIEEKKQNPKDELSSQSQKVPSIVSSSLEPKK